MVATPHAGEIAKTRDGDYEVCPKATTASSAMAPGIVNNQPVAGGNWAACSAGNFGRFGVITDEALTNVDGDSTFQNLTGPGAEVYVTFSNTNTVKGGQLVVADNSGKVKGYTEAAVTATPSQADELLALREFLKLIGTYRGKDESEGSGLDKPATDITNAVGRIRLGRY